MPLYRTVTGESEYSVGTYARQVVRLEDAARIATLGNLRAQPGVHATNVLTGAKSLLLEVNAVLLSTFFGFVGGGVRLSMD